MAFDSLLPTFRMRVLPSLLPTQIELDSDGTDVRWRYVGGDWQNLVPIADISATVTIGSVTTLPPGSPATAVNVGTDQNVVIDLGLPSGADGMDGAGAVDSVNGHTGVVVLAASDIGSTVTGDVAATTVQAAIAELASEKAPKDSPTFTGTVVIPDATLTPAKMQDGAARSVLGVAGNAGATRADIQAGNDGDVLRRSGTTVGFGTIVTAGIADAAVTLAKMANVATARLFGRTTAGSGVPEALTGTQATALLDAVVGDSGSGGTKGLVPAPGAGDAAAGKFLKADGSFAVPGAVLLGTVNTNSGATASVTWSGAYRFILIEIDGVKVNNSGARLTLATSVDAGSNYGTAVNITNVNGDFGDTFDGIAEIMGAGLSATARGKYVRPLTMITLSGGSDGTDFTTQASITAPAAGAINGVRVATGATFTNGAIRVYGFK